MPSPAQVQEAQDRARAQFRAWYHHPRAAVVDTEATGLEGRAFVFDFAAVPVATGLPTPAPLLSFLCTPPADAEWSDAARAMHTDRLTWAARCGIEAYSSPLLEVLSTFPVLAYGAEYDRDRLRFTLTEAGCPSEFPDFSCVKEAYAPLAEKWSESRGFWKFVSLEEACRREGVDIGDLQRHTAYGDAVATARLIRAVATSAKASARDNAWPFEERLSDVLDLGSWTQTESTHSDKKEPN